MQLLASTALVALIAATLADDCQPGSDSGKATATCTLNDGTQKTFDLTGAFTDPSGNPYLSSYATDNNYIFYVTAINPGLNSNMNLPMCQFADGFTDSNSGAQADNKPEGGTCWSTGDINAETWTYDESSQTMTIESIEGQDDRKTKLTVVCSSSSTPQITTKPEDPPKEYNFEIQHNSACINAPAPSPGPGPGPGGKGGKKEKDVGAILCGVFFGVLIGYFVIGFAVLKFGMKKEGVDTVPNYSFWASLPGLVKDGFSFTIAKARGTSGNYEQI
eukprot:TRINITY_DN12530_c0_g1_i12.p1 TRINITY_DN12530_c0_g1~~TRINITY_DN12530_c0_g1_i12.p1  ORF type:complete len:275 (+),score=81.50 TRINITY_DN12530_c0_g1_i12:69-893(+)